MFTWKSHAGLKFHFGQNDRYEIHTVLSFISPQFMWTQVKSWLNTEMRFSTEMKSHTSLSSFRLLCERTLRWEWRYKWMESLNLNKLLNQFLGKITFILYCANVLLTDLYKFVNVFSNSKKIFLKMEEQLAIPF